MSLCPCGSTKMYSECCLPIHNDHKMASRPEQLMRARYSAHVLKLVDFVIKTYHPSCKAEEQRNGITESVNLEWLQLQVISSPIPQLETGFVEFKAYMMENGTQHCMHERSRFLRENGYWYYVDGEFPLQETEKLGRNDPCSCGSGKKFKKCCG